MKIKLTKLHKSHKIGVQWVFGLKDHRLFVVTKVFKIVGNIGLVVFKKNRL